METIQLESFQTSLHGARILYTLPTAPTVSLYPPFMEWIQSLRDPFKKRISIRNSTFPLSKHFPLPYDATFHVKESMDWTLILTYITYAPKPLLVVVEDMSIPDGLWQKLTRATTVLHITSTPIVRLSPYDAIFFAPTEELTTNYVEYTHRILQSIYRASYTLKEHKEILQEVRVAKAGLAWTKVDEERPTGAMYWYDPVAVQPGERLSSKQLSELFGWLAGYYHAEVV
jgi:hypothetical protein